MRGHPTGGCGPSCVRSGMMRVVWADAIWFLPLFLGALARHSRAVQTAIAAPLGTLGDGLTWGYAETLHLSVSLAPASRRGFSFQSDAIWAKCRGTISARPELPSCGSTPSAMLVSTPDLAPASRRGFSCARHATRRFGTKFTSENWNCWCGPAA